LFEINNNRTLEMMMENDEHDCWSGINVGRETSKTSVDVPVLKRDLNESDETSTTWSEDNNTRSCASFCCGDNTNNNNSNNSSLGETSFNKFNKSLAVKVMGGDDHLEGIIIFPHHQSKKRHRRHFDDEHDDQGRSASTTTGSDECSKYVGHSKQQQQSDALTRDTFPQSDVVGFEDYFNTGGGGGGGTPRTLRIYESFACDSDDERFESVTSPRMFVFRRNNSRV
jgi:hypothetical protein